MGTIMENDDDLLKKAELTVAWLPNGCLVYSYATLVAFGNIESRTLTVLVPVVSQTTVKHLNTVSHHFPNRITYERTAFMWFLGRFLSYTSLLIEDEHIAGSLPDNVDAAGD